MRGIPPPPPSVALWQLEYDVDGSPASTWHWVFVPDLELFDQGHLEALWVALLFNCLGTITDLMATAAQVRTSRLRRYGAAPLDVTNGVAPNHGAFGDVTPLLGASGVYWHTSFAGRGGRAFTRWPALPDLWTDDQVNLNDVGYAQVGHLSALFLQEVNTTVAPLGGTCSLVSLHRQEAGAPLGVAQPRQIVAAVPVRHIASCVRRARSSQRR